MDTFVAIILALYIAFGLFFSLVVVPVGFIILIYHGIKRLRSKKD